MRSFWAGVSEKVISRMKPAAKAASLPLQGSRKQRRAQTSFNKRLNRSLNKRLKADGTPVSFKMSADGGVHATVDTRPFVKAKEAEEQFDAVIEQRITDNEKTYAVGIDIEHPNDDTSG
jgi:hypothetical protein